MLGLPPAFVLSQDQTLKLNENLAPAGHYLYDESQAHLPANHRSANLVNLSYVTARVSHRPQTLYLHIMNTVRKDSAVHVSLSSYLIVKQQSLVKKNSLPNPATHLRPALKRPLPGFFTGWFLGPRNSRETILAGHLRRRWRRYPYIGRARSHCQPAFSKNFQKAPPRLPSCGEFTRFSAYLPQVLINQDISR